MASDAGGGWIIPESSQTLILEGLMMLEQNGDRLTATFDKRVGLERRRRALADIDNAWRFKAAVEAAMGADA